MAFRYTDDMKAFLKEGFLTLDYKHLTLAFNAEFDLDKTPKQIQSAVRNFGYRSGVDKVPAPRAPFSEDQLTWLRARSSTVPVKALTPLFNAAFDTDKTANQIYGCLRKNRMAFVSSGFKKGHVPANKGKKGRPPSGKQRNTIFKKGHVPANQNPIGHEYVSRCNGYTYIKTDQVNPKTGKPGLYREKHVLTWEQHNGPVPKGHCVLLKDGNKQNCSDINNLMLVTRGQLAQLNKTKLINAPAELKEAALATVDLVSQLRRIERENPESAPPHEN